MNSFDFITEVFSESWELLLQSAPYMLFGLLIAGLLKAFLSPDYVAKHLGNGRFSSVLKASILGIPIPLCSCGVLPAAASLKKQGANKGATAAFLISTPESGVDSISITYALLDPIMTIARPVSAFVSAMVAGVAINIFLAPKNLKKEHSEISREFSCGCSGACSAPKIQLTDLRLSEKLKEGLKYAITDIWGDLAGWFFIGLLVAGLITVLIPDKTISAYLGGGLSSMLLMLCFGIPLYICATASTPIAAAFILKGVSPGTALVFLLVGPATNITSLSVLFGILGKKATAFYLIAIAIVAVICGLSLDLLYFSFGISAAAVVSSNSDVIPESVAILATTFLILLSIRPLFDSVKNTISSSTS
jgi:hypothetical protein